MENLPGKILLVDDDRHLLEAVKRQLGREFSLDTAENGGMALALLEAKGPYAVVMTDLRMPGRDGLALLAEVRKRAPDTVAMLLTGHADREMVIQAVNDGQIFRFLDKPCSNEALRTAWKAGLEQYACIWAARELHSLTKQRDVYQKVIVGLGHIVEIRDPYTAGHQRRVAQLAAKLAFELGLASEEMEAVRLAALVHDIGKIYVPAEILNRPGQLSELELGLIKVHPQVGYEILQPLDLEWAVSDMVLQHHERLDGSGYPQGLEGQQINLGARILAVADVVEAMHSHRPYRPALGVAEALLEIESQQNRKYDKAVVATCLHLFKASAWSFES